MPTVTDPANVNRLLPDEPADDVIFQMILDGQAWHHRLPTLPAGQVRVRVLNGTGIARLAERTARELSRLGFDVTGTGDAAAASATTVTYSGTAQADSAYTLTTALKATAAARNLLAEPAPQTGRPGPGHADHRQRFRGREGARRDRTPPAGAASPRPPGRARPGGLRPAAARRPRPRCRAATPAPASAPACPRRTLTPGPREDDAVGGFANAPDTNTSGTTRSVASR